ncbi:hypothetical protein [Pseudomonas sp. NPDC008258]|uniref:hypothetical protein n=1 Tax=Pseudomonas sp. NPDC008258 TaxID=3364418 RepID=UPI0036EB77D6
MRQTQHVTAIANTKDLLTRLREGTPMPQGYSRVRSCARAHISYHHHNHNHPEYIPGHYEQDPPDNLDEKLMATANAVGSSLPGRV